MLSLSLTAGFPLAVEILMTMLSGLDFSPVDLCTKSSGKGLIQERSRRGELALTGEEGADTKYRLEPSLFCENLVLKAVLNV